MERREGIERLRCDAQDLDHELNAAQMLSVDVPVFTLGMAALQDAEIFNGCVPHLKILQSGDDGGDHQFVLQASTKRVLRQNGIDVPLDDGAAATLRALDSALQFLGALAMSTGALVLWRRARFEPRAFRAQHIEQGSSLEVRFEETTLALTPPRQCHAGHLATALRLCAMLRLREWSSRFVLTYQKAQMFLATPVLAAVDLYEDAFLGFFRCLEYVTMTQALGGRRGQFDENRLIEAFEALGIQAEGGPAAAKKVGKQLVKRRAEAAAHLAHAAPAHPLEPREVLELKNLIDLMVRTTLAKAKLRAKAPATDKDAAEPEPETEGTVPPPAPSQAGPER